LRPIETATRDFIQIACKDLAAKNALGIGASLAARTLPSQVVTKP
jgi:hypothetical protein